MSRKRYKYHTPPASQKPQTPQQPEVRAVDHAGTKLNPMQFNDLAFSLCARQFEPKTVPSLDEIKARYSLPITLGTTDEERERLNMSFDSMGGFQMIQSSMQQHLTELGQLPMSSFLGYASLQALAQDPLIRACVQTVADDLTRKWIELIGGEEEDCSRIDELNELSANRYALQTLFHDAAAMVGYYGGTFIFIDTGADGEQLSLPLNFSSKSAELNPNHKKALRFVLIDPVNVTPTEYNCTNPLRKDYMQPKYWWVLGQRVHHSRMLRIVENEPPTLLKPAYNFLGIARTQLLADYVAHFKEARVYTIDLLKKISLLVVKTNVEQMFCTPDGIRNFDLKIQALQRYRDNNSIYVCDKNEEDVTNVQTSIAGATDIARQQLEFVAAINRTPAVKILGISPSGFNATGESDITNYYDHIRSQQELYRKAIKRCLDAIQLVHFGDIDQTISFEFNELAGDNASSKVNDANIRMQMLTTALSSNIISADEARQSIKNDPDMHLEYLEGDAPEGDMQDFGDMGELTQTSAPNEQPEQMESPKVQQPNDDLSKYSQLFEEMLSNEQD